MSALTRHPVSRLSIPLDDFGIGTHLFTEISSIPKRKRRTRFNRIRKYIQFSDLISSSDTIHSLALGLDAAGNLTVEVTIGGEHEET